MDALVLGWGLSGRAAAAELARLGYDVSVWDDQRVEEVDEFHFLHDLEGVSRPWDIVVASPGFAPHHAVIQRLQACKVEPISEIELAARKFPRHRWLGITGTNGKTTVTELVTHFLRAGGVKAHALGNIGTPLVSQELNEDEVIVAELSSYQIERTSSPVFDAAAILNITPDHLDYHGSMESYAAAKMRLSQCMKRNAPLYLHETVVKEWAPHHMLSYGRVGALSCPGDGKLYWHDVCLGELPSALKGKFTHHVENFMAAVALALSQDIPYDVMQRAYGDFKRPMHRIEAIGEWNGVRVIDDSKGTNIDAVIRALESIEGRVWLIAGGVHKGASYRSWIPYLEGKVALILLIGQAAPLIEQDVGSSVLSLQCGTLERAVAYAAEHMMAGETLLLSPGCSSFDQFKNYSDRGMQFRRFVVENFSVK